MNAQIQTADPAPTPRPSLRRYRCHKEVQAVKIARVDYDPLKTEFWIVPEDGLGFEVSEQYWLRHNPKPGGYYVLYDDGYESFSPAAPFESGYTLIEQ